LVFNGLRFARLGAVAPASLDSQYHGFHVESVKGVHLYTRDAKLEAYAVANDRQGYFAVTAHVPDGDGRARYMHSMTSTTARWLRLEDLGYLQRTEVVQQMRNAWC